MSSPTNRRVETYPAVPPDYDLLSASNDRLLYYGIPERPDADKAPDLYAFWEDLVSPVCTLRQPSFREPQPDMELRSLSTEETRKAGPVPAGHGAQESSLNWSGALVSPPFPKRIVTVVGGWTVPEVSAPLNQPLFSGANARSLIWIGLDGHKGRLPKISLPQIGTGQCMDSPRYFAWWDWWRNPPPGSSAPPDTIEFIDNFEVCPGDEILAGITVLVTEDVLFFIKNKTKGEFRSFLARRHLLGDIEPLGSSAEWIVERPVDTSSQKLKLCPLANYGTVNFKYCLALAVDQKNATSEIITPAGGARMIRMREAFAGPYRSQYVSRSKRRRDPNGSIGVTCTFNDSV